MVHSHPTNHGFQTFGASVLQGALGQAQSLGSGWPTGDKQSRPRESARERRAFNSVRTAESKYGAQLRSVAHQVGVIIKGLTPKDGVPDPAVVERALRAYSEMLRPWARAVGARMLADVSRRDEAVWRSMAQDMSRDLMSELKHAPTGETLRRLLDEQVTLITSIPLRAAERTHKLALEARASGSRYDTIVAEIMRSGHVTKSRATLIARTEVARTASGLVQTRATYVGSEGYIWRTAEDSDVRKSHKRMSGKFVPWSRPPTTDNLTGHAGQLPNCRCYPEPVIPDQIQ
jgi:SPP1 gp7 family putative phage head morphogenesis protein